MPKQKASSSSLVGEPHPKKARVKSSHSEDIDEEEEEMEEDEDEEDEGEEEEVYNQSQNPDFTAPFEAREAEYGIIEKVSVKNFICHGRLECKFGPNVNFVVGRNGSGKSAILTAIVVGLGGKAIATSRGHSVKKFIKDGKSLAEICIKLRNQGDDAFKPNEYGSSIIVERKLRREGGTAYKIKSASGRVISTKREELSHILDHFNIQVDNPVSIMNQETSKTFLQAKNPKDKYKFFLKATQLEQVFNDYREVEELKSVTEDSVAQQDKKLPVLAREVLELEEKFKALTCIQDLRKKRQDLMNQAAWAQVIMIEKDRDKAQSAVTNEEKRIPKFDEKIEEHKTKVQETERKHGEIQQRVEQLKQRLGELAPQYETSKKSVNNLKSTVKGLEKEIKQLTSQVRSLESDKEDMLTRIEDEKARDKAQFEAERVAREGHISALLKEKGEKEAQRQNAAREMDQFANAVNSAKEQSYGLKSRESEINQAIAASRRRLANLEGSKKNRLKLYGDYVPTLLEEINRQARQFHQKPLGPVGTYLQLKDPRWALGVEACLKGLIFSFCCHDHHDAQILKGIMARVVPANQPSIITAKFESHQYDISRNAVQNEDFPSFLDLVTVTHPVIFNTLLDQRTVESILLIESSRDARTYLRQGPRNCREAFTLEGDQIFAGAEQRFYSSTQKKPKVLQGDVQNEIKETKRDLSENQTELEGVRTEAQRLSQVITDNNNQRRRAQTHRVRLEEEIGKINNSISQLEAEGEEEDEPSVADLEGEVLQMEAQVSQGREKLDRLSRSFKEARRHLGEADQQFRTVDDQIQEINDQVDPLKDDLAQASIEVQMAKQYRKHYEDKKKDLLKVIAGLQREADQAQNQVEVVSAKARQVCPERIEVGRKAKNIDSEINQITKRIQKEQNKQGDPDIITKQYHDGRKEYETIKRQIHNMKKFIKKLQSILDQRVVALRDMRRFIAQRTKYFFITMMSTRGYHGQLNFDHTAEHLIIKVDPGENVKASRGASKDVRSLSGGERSFSTVCLIMALWESVESPFRAMDEFDVFMDMMNRKICIELMMQFARDQPIRQFIFLTPQDMSKITPSRFVRIYRLSDPERSQGYLTRDAEQTQDDDWETEN